MGGVTNPRCIGGDKATRPASHENKQPPRKRKLAQFGYNQKTFLPHLAKFKNIKETVLFLTSPPPHS